MDLHNLLNLFGLDASHTLFNLIAMLAMSLPVLGNFSYEEGDDDGDEGEDNDFDAGDEGLDDEGDDDAPPVADEPFHRYGDRQVYSTADDLKRAYDESQKLIERYRSLGKPEELAAIRERANNFDRFSKAFESGNGSKGGDDNDKLFDHIPEANRGKWKEAFEGWKPVFEKAGYVSKAQVEQMLEEMLPNRLMDVQRRTQTYELAQSRLNGVLSARGVTPTAEHMQAVEQFATAYTNNNPEIAEMWQRGDVEGYVDRVIGAFFGVDPQQKSNPTATGRDANGRFASRQYAETKRKRLPNVGPDGGRGGSDEVGRRKPLTPEAVKDRVNAIFDEDGL